MKLQLFIFLFLIVFLINAQNTNTRKWRYTERDSLDNALLLYEETFYKVALPIFEKIHTNHPKDEFIKYLYGICCLYRSDRYQECLTALSEVYAKNTNIDMIEYDLARAYHYNNKFDAALDYVNKHLAYKRNSPESKAKGELLKKHILNAKYYSSKPTQAKIINIGNSINSSEDEFSPAIAIDESLMLFNYKGSKSKGGKLNIYLKPDVNGSYTSDIYLSEKKDNQFQQPIPLDYINSIENETSLSLSQDGQILFTYKDVTDGHGDIYISYLNGNNYSKPSKLRGKINTYSWDGNCSLSPDGKTLYFSSERSGGFGGKDIYKAKLLADSVWGKITNLGDSINTPFDEDAPFMHADGVTLFYSSKGVKSAGGYDVFKSKLDLKDSIFKSSKNLGFPINTPDDDIFFVLSANGQNAYYSSVRQGGVGQQDIYTIQTNFDKSECSVVLLKGNLLNGNTIVDADIKIETITKNNLVYKNFKSNKGKYLCSLPVGEDFKITFTKAGLPIKTHTLSTLGLIGYHEKNYNINFDSKYDSLKQVIASKSILTKSTQTLSTPKTFTQSTTVLKTPTTTLTASKNTTLPLNPSVTQSTVAVAKVNTPTLAVLKTSTIVAVSNKTIVTIPNLAINKVITPTITASKIPTLATTNKTTDVTQTIVVKTATAIIPTSSVTTFVETKTNSVRPAVMTLENFVPITPVQEKTKLFTEKYPNISADSLDFRIQIAAFKFPKTYLFPHLKDCGSLENLLLEDGITRLTIGGSFKTLKKAYEHNKKVVIAGQTDAFVTAIYNRKRVSLEDLERMGIFK